MCLNLTKIQTVKAIIGLITVIVCSCGLSGNMYSFRRNQFYTSRLLLAYCLSVVAAVTVIYARKTYEEYVAGQLELYNTSKIYYYINLAGAVINYGSQFYQTNAVLHFFKRVPFFDSIRYFDIKAGVVKFSTIIMLVKIVIFPLTIELVFIFREFHKGGDYNIWQSFYTLYPIVVTNVVPNCVFGSFVLCNQFTIALNERLTDVEQKANFYQDVKQTILHKPFQRMQIFCDLSDILDELAVKYSEICLYSLEYMQIGAVPLLMALLSNLFGITVGFFKQYYALADTFISNETYDVFDAFTSGILLGLSIAEIAFYSMEANKCLEQIRETSLILKRIQLNNCDIRFRQSVERFSLQIFVQQFKIQPMGLIEINMNLLHDVLSAVTSFLLILIQSDLTLRFSLK